MSRKKPRIVSSRPEKQFFMFMIIVILGLISLIILDPIFAYLTYGREIDFTSGMTFESIVRQFSFPINNMLFINSIDHDYRYFQDFYIWLISILPSYLTSKFGINEPIPLYEYNTMLQYGSMLNGGLPSDILTFGIYQLGIAGLVIVSLIFGIIISRADNLLTYYKEDQALAPVVARVLIYLGMMVMYADLEGTFRGRFDVILLVILLTDMKKYKPDKVISDKR